MKSLNASRMDVLRKNGNELFFTMVLNAGIFHVYSSGVLYACHLCIGRTPSISTGMKTVAHSPWTCIKPYKIDSLNQFDCFTLNFKTGSGGYPLILFHGYFLLFVTWFK